MASLIIAAIQHQQEQRRRQELQTSVPPVDEENPPPIIEPATTAAPTSDTAPSTAAEPTTPDEEALHEWEARRRRQSLVFVILFFILLRLWMQALMTGDGGLLLFCVALSVWFTKVQEQRRAEEEAMLAGSLTLTESRTDSNPNAELSFQMQLAIAMMESQRMMHAQMRNGMMPEVQSRSSGGVPASIQQNWHRFTLDADGDISTPPSANESKPPLTSASDTGNPLSRYHRAFMERRLQRQYASLQESDAEAPPPLSPTIKWDHDVTSCSICLQEYEPAEVMVQFPCGHVFHDDCAKAWLVRSVRCPLCNYTLDQPQS